MRNFQGPVQIQHPMAVPDVCYAGGLFHAAAQLREVGRRRIIVQIDTGNVLGLELDRSEKVQSVKKKVQAALCVPTEQSDLLFGDHVIEKDLSEVRNDTPLLLTRGLHRSSSTPCLSPTVDLSPIKDWSLPVELVGSPSSASACCPTIKTLVHESVEALESGVEPVLAAGGLGGAYFFKNMDGKNIAIVKPTDEEPFAPNNPKGFVGKVLGEPGLKRAIRVGETGIREVAAYLLDHGHFARVPATALVKVRHSAFNVNRDKEGVSYQGDGTPIAKIASFQQFVHSDSDASDIGTSRFPVSAVHRIGILDVRIFNTDRHGGNILVRRTSDDRGWVGDSFELIPIDHGLCLPETLDDPYFEWLHWPQASMPFSEEEMNYINGLDPYADAEMLRKELPMLREGCLRMLILCTVFLQNAARSGLNLAEIGAMMSREICEDGEELSELEEVCIMAKMQVEDEAAMVAANEDDGDDGDDDSSSIVEATFEFDEDEHWDISIEINNVEEGDEQEDEEEQRGESIDFEGDDILESRILEELVENNKGSSQGAAFLGAKLRPFGSGSKYKRGGGGGIGVGGGTTTRGNSRYDDVSTPMVTTATKLRRFYSARPASSSLEHHGKKEGGAPGVVLSHMSDAEWGRFMEAFEGLLEDAFAKRKTENLNFVQRLGTSCQF